MKNTQCSISTTDKIFMVLVLWMGSASFALAWNMEGHMLVADVAWASLAAAPLVRNALKSILQKAKGNFQPAGNSDAQIRGAFDYAATLPDHIKQDLTTAYEPLVLPMNLHFNGRPSGKEGLRCRSWHYFDTPINVPAGVQPHVYQSNLLVAWAEAKLRLRQLHKGIYNGPQFAGISNDDLMVWWLAWVLHLAGDAHQPLHAVSNYAFNPNGDEGGNKFLLDGKNELHGFWDNLLVSSATTDGFHISTVNVPHGAHSANLAPVTVAWTAAHAPSAAQAAEHDVSKWIQESAAAAQSVAYHNITQGQAPSAAYVTGAQNYARPAAVRGGVRLAGALQEVFA
jgi:hypothetical protein